MNAVENLKAILRRLGMWDVVIDTERAKPGYYEILFPDSSSPIVVLIYALEYDTLYIEQRIRELIEEGDVK